MEICVEPSYAEKIISIMYHGVKLLVVFGLIYLTIKQIQKIKS